NLVLITLGTGLGGGIVIDGKLYSGFNYAGAELGHMVIVAEGRQCSCGRKGCWEAYASASGLINLTKDKMKETKDTIMWDIVGGDINKTSGRTAFNAMKQGDKAGAEVVDLYLKYLACGMTNIVNIFQPEIFCIGGGISNEGDPLLLPVQKYVNDWQYGTHAHDDKTVVKLATLKNDAGIIGAAVLGL
ncbi:MAG: ROK family protein, partial [Clostridia bacterium]|nr:ROK family protein [Clostridia bacterium]